MQSYYLQKENKNRKVLKLNIKFFQFPECFSQLSYISRFDHFCKLDRCDSSPSQIISIWALWGGVKFSFRKVPEMGLIILISGEGGEGVLEDMISGEIEGLDTLVGELGGVSGDLSLLEHGESDP